MTTRRILFAAMALALAAPASATPNPLYKNSVGGGSVTGSVACDTTATATGTVYNTVGTGYVGQFALRATCDPTFTVTVTGDAVTGSTLRCTLVGTHTTDGVTEHVDVAGECRINSNPTNVRWRVDGATGAAGRFTVELA